MYGYILIHGKYTGVVESIGVVYKIIISLNLKSLFKFDGDYLNNPYLFALINNFIYYFYK